MTVTLENTGIRPEFQEKPVDARTRSMGQVATFGFVHGAGHGGWCWERVTPLIEEAGYKTVIMDLPVDDPSASTKDYVDCIADSLCREKDVKLVVHSMAGALATQVTESIPAVSQVIYSQAALRRPEESLQDQLLNSSLPPRNSETFLASIKELGNGLSEIPKDAAKELFYHDCDDDTAEWAASRLRPQSRHYWDEVSDTPVRPEAHIPVASIISRHDRVLLPTWSRLTSVDWLGVKPIEIDGGHSPFLSRSKEYAHLLLSLI